MGEAGQAQRDEVPAARGEVPPEAGHERPWPEGDLHVDQGAQQRPAERLGDGLLRRPHGEERGAPVRRGTGLQIGPFGVAEGLEEEGGGRGTGQELDVDPEGGPRVRVDVGAEDGPRGGAHVAAAVRRGPPARARGDDGGDRHGPAVGRRQPQRGQPLTGEEGGAPPRVGRQGRRAGLPVAARCDGVPQQCPAAPPARRVGSDVPPEVHRAGRRGHRPAPGLSRKRRCHGWERGREGGRARWRASR